MKSVYNQCNGNVRAQPKSALISVIRGPKRRLLFSGGTSVKSVYNQCNGNVRAQPKSV